MSVDLDKKERCTEILNGTLDRMLEAVNEDLLVCKVVIQLIKQGYDAVPEWYSGRRGLNVKPDIIVNDEIAVEVKRVYGCSSSGFISTGIGQCVRYLHHYKEAWLIVDIDLEKRLWEEMVWMKTILPIRFWTITNDVLQEVK